MLDVQPQCYGSHGNPELIPLSRQKSHTEKTKYPSPYNSSITGNVQDYDGWGFGKHDLVESIPAKGRGVETR